MKTLIQLFEDVTSLTQREIDLRSVIRSSPKSTPALIKQVQDFINNIPSNWGVGTHEYWNHILSGLKSKKDTPEKVLEKVEHFYKS